MKEMSLTEMTNTNGGIALTTALGISVIIAGGCQFLKSYFGYLSKKSRRR